MNQVEWAYAIENRDNWICQECGVTVEEVGTFKIHAHHIQSVSEGGQNTLDNGITVCHDCHWNVFHANGKGMNGKISNKRSPKMRLPENTLLKIDELKGFGYGYNVALIVSLAVSHLFESVLLNRDDCKDIAMNPDVLNK